MPLGQGLLINNRMADLKKAKLYAKLSQAERDLEVANVLYLASNSYFNWYKNYNEYKLYETFLKNPSENAQSVWTCNEKTKRGDIIVMYVLSPYFPYTR